LTPGSSTITDVARILGKPVRSISPTLVEYAPSAGIAKIEVEYRTGSPVIERIEVYLLRPVSRAALSQKFNLSQQANAQKTNGDGKLIEFFGGSPSLAFTYATADAAGGVTNIGYFSRELFAATLGISPGNTQFAPGSLSADGTLSPNAAQPAPPRRAPTNASVQVFDKVDMLVPKGDKADEKSAKLIFQGDTLVIQRDKHNEVLKSFPYENINSAEYSYSTSPRWKTGIGAAVVLGVFALPIFLMKGKKHWLTIKTADDFAILHLDKDNYKIILPTFEARTGKRVETVEDHKK
jgi:hypothetical protein